MFEKVLPVAAWFFSGYLIVIGVVGLLAGS
jgi:hypothetical protein